MDKKEKVLIAAMAVVLALIIALIIIWLVPQKTGGDTAQAVNDGTQQLSMPEDNLPQNLTVGTQPPSAALEGADGGTVYLSEYEGRPALVIFWGSWCTYCKQQLEIFDEIKAVAAQYNAEIILVDKLDPEKETLDAAKDALKAYGSGFTALFDEGLRLYNAWGLKLIPTSVVLRADGTVGAFAEGILSKSEYDGLFDYAVNGGDAATLAYIEKYLDNGSGGIMCSETNSGVTPGGHDVLSETQGLMMQYAVNADDKTLFDKAYAYVKSAMQMDGLAAWYVTQNGEKAPSSAALDDLRIVNALLDADEKWGGYQDAAAEIAAALLEKCTDNGNLVSFYEFDTGNKAQSLSLCYADIKLLNRLAQLNPAWADIAQNASATLDGGYVSDEFPLYRASYDYKTKKYSNDDLNTAEALYALWNLAKNGELKPQSLAWLKAQVSAGSLAARYTVQGEAVKGYDYYSTAVYALAALVGSESGDDELLRTSLMRMERYRENDTAQSAYGRFGDAGAAAFDECVPLLIYSVIK